MTKESAKRARKSTQNSGDRRKLNKGRVENLKPFKPGQSGNPGGRPKLLGEAYKAKLARLVPDDPEGRTYAEIMADAITLQVIKGDVAAAREIRSATEGETHVLKDAWKQEVIDLLKSGTLSPENVIEAIGLDDARSLFIAAGIAILPGASEQQSATGADSRPAA